ncbi:MAG: DUF1989 domain-containing protein [Kineosporiaceae bacterium]
MLTIDVPPMSGRAVRLSAGQRLRVIDVEGQQLADLVAFTPDASEWFSQGESLTTRWVHNIYHPAVQPLPLRKICGVPGKTGLPRPPARGAAERGLRRAAPGGPRLRGPQRPERVTSA